MVLGQSVEINSRELAEEAVLRGNPQREYSGKVAARAFQFLGSNGQRTNTVHFVKYFGERSSGNVVAHSSVHAEISMLAERLQTAARAVGVAFLFADIDDQARMKCAAIN